MSQEIVRELREQFRRQWETIRELVNGVPADQWTGGEPAHLVPARLVYHILSGTEVYARSCSYEEYLSRRRCPLNWQTAAPAELPDKPETLMRIEELERAVEHWLEALGDEGLLARDEGFPWTGTTPLARAVYLLRHTQNHIGEANAELRHRGLPRGKWH